MAVLVTVEVGDSGTVAVLVAVEVGEGGIVAVEVAVGRAVGVLLGTQPPCIKLPKMVSESASEVWLARKSSCISDAFTALNDRQVNGINRPIKSASSASRISVVRFLFLFSIQTSLSQWLTTPVIELICLLVLQVPCRCVGLDRTNPVRVKENAC